MARTSTHLITRGICRSSGESAHVYGITRVHYIYGYRLGNYVTIWKSCSSCCVSPRKLVCFCRLFVIMFICQVRLSNLQETGLGNYRRKRLSLRNLECRKVVKFYSQTTAAVPTIKKYTGEAKTEVSLKNTDIGNVPEKVLLIRYALENRISCFLELAFLTALSFKMYFISFPCFLSFFLIQTMCHLCLEGIFLASPLGCNV